MSGSNWFALAGVLFSCLALGLSLVTYRLQARTAKSDAEKELADQILAIQSEMAKLGSTASSENPMRAIADTSNVNAALQVLLLRVAGVIRSSELDPDWYQIVVLAAAALQVGDLTSAGPYAKRAVELAGSPEDRGWDPATGSTAQTVSLRMRGAFHFSRGLSGDDDLARNDFKLARQVVRDNRWTQGPFTTSGQLIELYIRQTEFELDLGNPAGGVDLIRKACREWRLIEAPAPRRATGALLCTYAQNQSWLPADDLLPGDFRDAWAAFQGDHGAAPAPSFDLSALHPINLTGAPSTADATPAAPDR